MWQMIAEPGLRCAQCRHPIAPGRLCLSELPEETPPGSQRGDFRNYCIGCPQRRPDAPQPALRPLRPPHRRRGKGGG